jgi:hypothetical protein
MQRLELKDIDVAVFVTSHIDYEKKHDPLEVKSLKIIASQNFEEKFVPFGSA